MNDNIISSLYRKTSRYAAGGTCEVSSGRIEWWEKTKINLDSTDRSYTLEDVYEDRPDLLALAIYGDDRLAWVILQVNSIFDPLTEFKSGISLRIPTHERIQSELMSVVTAIPSTRK